MSEEDRKLQKHLVDEMMKVSKTNPDVIIYMEALMKKYEELEQKVEQLEKENIRQKEVIELINKNSQYPTYYLTGNIVKDLLNILNKGENNE